MRVISGYLGGQNFESPNSHKTHPMSEKMRGALFGALGDIKGLRVLDAFAGSGAVSIEAISRGAKSAQAIEMDPAVHTVIQKNINKLGLGERVTATRAYCGAWSTRHQAVKFDVIVLDPPYDNIPYRDLKRMPRHLDENGILVLSWPSKMDPLTFEGLKLIKTKTYADGSLNFYSTGVE